MAEPMIEMSQVQKIYKRHAIIRELNLAIARGQVVALLGGNGAGKSTILRMLAGIAQPTRGEIVVGGYRWKQNRQLFAQQLGYMPDDYRFSPGLTAKETMIFWSKLRGLPRERASEVLAAVGLEHTGSKPVASFSKGMRQRIMFAQALLARPPVILMDEPTNGLDLYWMEGFIRLVREAATNGQTIVFSTHQLQVAEVLADRIIFLQDGTIQLDGTAQQIREQLDTEGLQDAFAALFGISNVAGEEVMSNHEREESLR